VSGPVLIVEDDQAIRDTLTSILEDEGYQVWSAVNGRDALDRLASGPRPGLLIVDLVMPILNGWDLCAELARRPELADLPVLVVSANATTESPLPLPQARLMQKPIPFQQLLEEVERHCRG
jgi:CheY-like chemotaxis protein